jgi:peptidoglycan pentaglycine glycine transferase (the first glycine)
MILTNHSNISLIRKTSLEGWNDALKQLPDPHLLQTREWSSIKAPLGWAPLAYTWEDDTGRCKAACLILKRQVHILPGLLTASILYSPRGPILNWDDQPLVMRILSDLKTITRDEGAIFIKIDPDIIQAHGMPGAENEISDEHASTLVNHLKNSGWQFSRDQIQFRNSLIIDLATPDTTLLERMKQKTRYNIRLAERKGVTIRKGQLDDARMLSQMYMQTALRNQFAVREREYYEHVWEILFNAGMLSFLIAEVDHEPVAGLVLFHFAKRAYYFYGMSTERHRDYMPTYLLQWRAIQVTREMGCSIYDLWGAPDEFNESDKLWGVFRFKEGLGGQVIRTIGAWDFPARKWQYRIYTNIMPRILAVMRSLGKRRTAQEINL